MTETTTKLTVRMPTQLHKSLRIAAIEHDTTVQSLVIEAVEKYLSNLDG